MDKKKVAWTVTDEYADKACVVFHHHGLAARRLGSGELGEDFDWLVCNRSPEFDEYAESGKVPTKALIDAGWWFECGHCGKQIPDEDEAPVEELEIDGDWVYCNSSCKCAREKEISERNENFDKFKEKVQKLRPDINFTDFKGGHPWITNIAKFTFPGAKYGGSARDQNGDGNIEFFISNGDLEAWNQYEATRGNDQ
ncbi:MAG: hypothetical protein ACRCSE_01765 [Vibrio sp.]